MDLAFVARVASRRGRGEVYVYAPIEQEHLDGPVESVRYSAGLQDEGNIGAGELLGEGRRGRPAAERERMAGLQGAMVDTAPGNDSMPLGEVQLG
jgi:hypothetical protein